MWPVGWSETGIAVGADDAGDSASDVIKDWIVAAKFGVEVRGMFII